MDTKINHAEKHKLLARFLDGPDLSSILDNGHDKVDIDLSNNLINIDWFYRKVCIINQAFDKVEDSTPKKSLFEQYQKELGIKCKRLEETGKYCVNLFDTIKNPPGTLKISDEFRPKKHVGVLCDFPHPALDTNFANSRVMPILQDISYNAYKIIKSC